MSLETVIRVWLAKPPDVEVACKLLRQAGMDVCACPDVDALITPDARNCGAILIEAEGLSPQAIEKLNGFLRGQPAWSDLPVILLARRGAGTRERKPWPLSIRNLTVVDRPVTSVALVSVLQTALHARQRQYEIRDLLARLQEQNQTLSQRMTELHQSEERFRALAMASTDGLYRMSPDWSEMRVLRGGDFVANTEEVSRTWLDKYIPPSAQAVVLAAIRKAIESKRLFEIEHPVYLADGSLGWTRSRAVPMLDEQGEIVEWFGTASNITDRKLGEVARSRLAAIVESSNDAIISRNIDGTIVTWNAAAERLFGYTAAEVVGRPITFLIPPDRIQEEEEILGRIIAGERVEKYETVRVAKDGHTIEVLLTSSPLKDDAGRVVGVSKIMRDITERLRAESALRDALSKLERSNNELVQFAHVAAHDLQEPLRMVESFLTLLQENYQHKLDDKGRDYIAFACDGAHRMKALVSDLLEYARVGGLELALEPVNLQAVLGTVLINLKVRIEENNAIITHDPLPTITADAHLIERVLQNIIGNALKFRDPNRRLEIHIGTKRIQLSQSGPPIQARDQARAESFTSQPRTMKPEPSDSWIFYVRDNGIGIDPRFKDRIFQIFQRLHGREEYEGTGIGLAICQTIIQRHGGHIWVESEPGKGSTFFFTLSGD